MKHSFKYEDFVIYGESGQEPHAINVEVELRCTDKGRGPSFGPMHDADPGHPPEWEVRCVWLHHPQMTVVMMTETQFILIFPDGQDVINNALEDAHCNGEINVQDIP